MPEAGSLAAQPVAHEDVFSAFREAFSRPPEQLRQIAHIKRFLERFQGDDVYRGAVLTGVMSLEEAAAACGCELDLTSLQPVFNIEFSAHRSSATADDWPLTALWDEHLHGLLGLRDKIREIGDTAGADPAFDQWRRRQINRTAFELGAHSQGIVHPPVTFELSSGCSVGCWFCGISAAKFGGNFSVQGAGRDEWEQTLRAVQSVLGPGLKTGFCYWATEPLDNPEYADFLDVYEEVVGVLPQTTSAIPLRNKELTRAVLARWERSKSFPNRFSVLTTKILLQIHQEFTPEELLGVELVLQNKGSPAPKSGAGRAYQGRTVQAEGPVQHKNGTIVNGTIACVTGFLINIVERRVRLISPTAPCDEWPDGYIVFDDARYGRPENLAATMKEMIARNMGSKIDPHAPIRFGQHIDFFDDERGVGVESAHVKVETRLLDVIGRMINDGDKSPLQIVQLASREGVDPFQVVGVITDARRAGLIESVPLQGEKT